MIGDRAFEARETRKNHHLYQVKLGRDRISDDRVTGSLGSWLGLRGPDLDGRDVNSRVPVSFSRGKRQRPYLESLEISIRPLAIPR